MQDLEKENFVKDEEGQEMGHLWLQDSCLSHKGIQHTWPNLKNCERTL